MFIQSGTTGSVVAQELECSLRRGPHTAAQLMAHLDVSQPTLSRAIHRIALSTTFRLTGDRTPRYALLRTLPLGLPPRPQALKICVAAATMLALSGAAYAPFPDVAWSFNTHGGPNAQYVDVKSSGWRVVAVRPGDVTGPVPEPQTLTLALLGLGATGVARRRSSR